MESWLDKRFVELRHLNNLLPVFEILSVMLFRVEVGCQQSLCQYRNGVHCKQGALEGRMSIEHKVLYKHQ